MFSRQLQQIFYSSYEVFCLIDLLSSGVQHDKSSQLKQWPSSAEASSSRSIPLHCDSSEGKYSHQFRTSSPVSVLESSGSSCSAENLTSSFPKLVIPVKRPRSKRPRPRRHAFPFISISNTPKKFRPLAASESESESYLDEKTLNLAKKKEKKKKNLMLLSCTVEIGSKTKQPVETRKCTHCEVTKTPQWREGPKGPKTLCNACGVRYRSGRLLPEYRPAASPTFVPSMHSNSHRKVLEMRKKTKPVTGPDAMDGLMPTAPEYSF